MQCLEWKEIGEDDPLKQEGASHVKELKQDQGGWDLVESPWQKVRIFPKSIEKPLRGVREMIYIA